MTLPKRVLVSFVISLAVGASAATLAQQTQEETFKPVVGQEGKDVVWVPTPPALVEKMLDLAAVTPQDYVIDLGSGDGRNVIAAAKRGARALGVEFNPKMVEVSAEAAASAGVADKAVFVQGDMYEADISEATVLALFLLPENLRKLTPKFLALRPGTRIVANHFGIDGWEADQTDRTEGDCPSWCTALLYIVPAQAAGTWRLPQGQLMLEQQFQKVSGQLTTAGAITPVDQGRVRGDEIRFSVAGVEYVGRIRGQTMNGHIEDASRSSWKAERVDR